MKIHHRNPDQHFSNQKRLCIDHLIKTEFFIHGLQQRILQNEISRQVSNESLSIKAFKVIYPLTSQIFDSSVHKQWTFELIRQIAENPHEEFGGRCLYSQFRGDFANLAKQMRLSRWPENLAMSIENTQCGATHDVLKITLFGIDELTINKLHIFFSSTSMKSAIAHFKKAWKAIEQNAAALKIKNSPDIYAYGFSLEGKSQFPGHGYWVVQYLDENGKIRYRFFQSFLFEEDLKGYLDKKLKPLTHAEFKDFFEGIQKCFLAELWTEELENIFFHHFGSISGLKVGNVNDCRKTFHILWGKRNFSDVVTQFQKFEEFRCQPGFPKIQTYQRKA